jgi:nicotinic acid mononucleotide adenylyltransferase
MHAKEVHIGVCAKHAFGKNLADFKHRIAMAETLFQNMHRIVVSNIEYEIWSRKPNEPVYSFDVATALIEKYSTNNIALCVGPDVALNLHNFYKNNELLDHVSILVAPGHVALSDTRSTRIREYVAARNFSAASQLTSPAVIQYIQEHNLFQ